jgi:hypothetical protein
VQAPASERDPGQTATQATIIDGLVRLARPIILEGWHARSCIASTRVGHDVLAYFGVPAAPTAVVVSAWNQTAWAAVERGETPDFEHTDAWSAGVAGTSGVNRATQRWDGHLVLVVADRVLVDLTVGQLHRPERGIELPEAGWWPVLPTFAQGQPVLYPLPRGGMLSYRQVNDRAWKRAPDWTGRDGRFRTPVGRIIRAIRGELAAQRAPAELEATGMTMDGRMAARSVAGGGYTVAKAGKAPRPSSRC